MVTGATGGHQHASKAAADWEESMRDWRLAMRDHGAHVRNEPWKYPDGPARDFTYPVRGMIEKALNPDTHVDDLSELACIDGIDSAGSVRASVALNPSLPAESMLRLAKDRITLVRSQLARNVSLPVDLLDVLVGDRNMEVRLRAIGNPRVTSEAIGRVMSQDKVESMRFEAYRLASARLSAQLDIAEENTRALHALLTEYAWWELTSESPEVALTRILHPDP